MIHVDLRTVAAQPTFVVRARTTMADFPALWKPMLDEVHATLAKLGIRPGRNLMRYTFDANGVDLEVGVLVTPPLPSDGRAAPSWLPAGRVAWTVHRGPYADLRATHAALLDWCEANGHVPTGVRWEIYGHERGRVPEVDVVALLREP